MKSFVFVLLAFASVAMQAADDSRFVPLSFDQVGGKSLAGYAPGTPWASVPQGRQTFAGVPFDIVAKLQLQGTVDAQNNRFYASRAIGIQVQQRFARLHVLHGGNISEQDGRPMAALRLHYAGGKTYTLFITYGVHVRYWWKNRQDTNDSVTDTNSAVVWTGHSVDSDRIGSTHRLYKTSFELPASEQEIERIDVFSLFSRSSPIIVALTGEAPGAAAPAGKALPSADDGQFRDDLVLRATDIAGNPLGGARVRGTAIDERGAATVLGKMDDSLEDIGIVTVDFPAGTRELHLTVSAPGCVPSELQLKTSAGARFSREVPVKLEPGVRIGGFVRDVDGKPLPKAKVEMFRATRDAAGNRSLFKYEENTSDSQGRWRLREAPESLENLLFRVAHPDFRRGEFEFSGNEGTGALTRDALLQSQAEFKLVAAPAIAGTVEDQAGRLLRNIEVLLVRTNESGGSTTTRKQTDAQGKFRFTSVEPAPAHLVVQNAPNFAPIALAIEPVKDTAPVKIVLASGAPLKGRFFETIGTSTNTRPVPRVNVTISPANQPFVRKSFTTDAEGRFVWEHAPEGSLRITAYAPNSGSRNFTARAGSSESAFDLGSVFLWKAHAIDAETKKPVTAFTVTLGHQYGGDRVNWMSYQAVQSTNGEVAFTDRNNPNVMKIEAPDYAPKMMPMPERDSSTNVFALDRAINLKGVVKLPDGQPAAGAEIAAVGEGYLSLGRGAFINHRTADYTNLIVKSDEQGRFELLPRISQRVVFIHEQGFADTTQSNLALKGEVTLQPFGTVEGVLMIGSKPGTNAPVHLSETRTGQGLNYDYSVFGGQTDSQGKFRYTHVPPGTHWLSRLIETRPNSRSWSHSMPIKVESGRTLQTQIGGTGRPVIGSVVADDPARVIDWTGGYHYLYSRQPPMRFASAAEARAWNSSPAAQMAQDNYRHYAVVFSTNGTFRVDDIPPGLYSLQCQFNAPRPGGSQYGDGPLIGTMTHQFEIPPLPEGRSDEPFDLGKLEFKVRR